MPSKYTSRSYIRRLEAANAELRDALRLAHHDIFKRDGRFEMHRQTMLALLQSRHVSEAIAILRYRGEWPL